MDGRNNDKLKANPLDVKTCDHEGNTPCEDCGQKADVEILKYDRNGDLSETIYLCGGCY